MEGNISRSYNANPIHNMRVYDIMSPDGAIQQYLEYLIAESMYS